ncbi:MAG: nitroreductase/quinone reductase family protein [Actinomycetota bacterium]
MATLSGRIVNLMSRRLPGLARKATHRQIAQFRASGGAKGNKLRGMECFLLDVVGRSSGESRPVMLMLARRDDDIVVIGSNGGNPVAPNWWRNLEAAGDAHVEVGAQRWAVDFREVHGDEKAECWKIGADAYPDFDSYQELTDRVIPVGVLSPKT